MSPSGRRKLLWGVAALVGVIVLAGLIGFRVGLAEPLRSRMEATMNAHLKGYKVRIEALELDILNLGLSLQRLIVTQNAHPKPPVARIDALNLRVHWRALLRARVLGDVELNRPALHIDLTHLRSEARDEVPVHEKGWQEAIEAAWLTINRFTVTNGKLMYVDTDREHPLRMSDVYFVAENIRIVHAQEQEYPSELWMKATLFDSGRLRAEGRANFLSAPFPGVKLDVALEKVELRHLKPVAIHADLQLERGVLSANGDFEYSPRRRVVHLAALDVDAIDIKYVRREGSERVQEVRLAKAEEVAESLTEEPETNVRVDRVAINNSTLGFADESTEPHYVISFADTDITLRELTNKKTSKPAHVSLTGQFMGSGQTVVEGTFRTDKTPPEFRTSARIENTDLPALNDVFRAYGDLDVARGKFSLYSELTAEGGELRGYIKPLFTDMEVYARRQDRDDSLVQQVYEGAAGTVVGLLRNKSDNVATVADISGRISDPDVSTWQIVFRLVRNAFIKAIVPGLERESRNGNSDGNGAP